MDGIKDRAWMVCYGNAFFGNCTRCNNVTINSKRCEYRNISNTVLPLCIECADIKDNETFKSNLISIYKEFRPYFEARVGMNYTKEGELLYAQYLKHLDSNIEDMNKLLTDFYVSEIWRNTRMSYEKQQFDILLDKWKHNFIDKK